MNILTIEMRRSMRQLDLGLKGELTITTEMESLSDSLFLDQVPPSWTKRAYDSLNGLTAWYSDLLLRIKELEMWTSDFALPPSVWLSGIKTKIKILIESFKLEITFFVPFQDFLIHNRFLLQLCKVRRVKTSYP